MNFMRLVKGIKFVFYVVLVSLCGNLYSMQSTQLQLHGKLINLQASLASLSLKLCSLKDKLDALKKQIAFDYKEVAMEWDGMRVIMSGHPEYVFNHGNFDFKSFSELEKLKKQKVGSSKFNIIFYGQQTDETDQNNRGYFEDYANVDALMVNPLNRGAMFQFASNDNPTLLVGGGQAGPFLKTTQAGAVFREKTSKIKNLGTCPPNKESDILVGIHENIQASWDGIYFVFKPTQLVNISIVAAYNNSGPKNDAFVARCQKVAHEGTLLAAMQTKTHRVFLSMVGMGIFKNRIDFIVDAIINALDKYLAVNADDCGLDVTLLFWNEYNDTDLNHLKLVAKVKEIGGFVCKFNRKSKQAAFTRYDKGGGISEVLELNRYAKRDDLWDGTDALSIKLFGPKK